MAEPLRLIALTGRAGAGKDSVAATLVRHLNYQTIAFADALREEIAAAWRIDPRMLMDPATKELPIPALAILNCASGPFVNYARTLTLLEEDGGIVPRSPRWVMQNWGDFKRAANPHHYAQIVARWVRRQYGTGWSRLLVTDLRYLNELAWLYGIPGADLRVVRVHRPGLPALPPTAHSSETDLRDVEVDHDLVNDGTLADLVREALRMEEMLYVDN